MRQRTHKKHPESKMFHRFNPLGKKLEPQGNRQGRYAQMTGMWNEGGMLCRLWEWHTGMWKVSGRDQVVVGPTRLCLFTLCRLKAGKLQLDCSEHGEGGDLRSRTSGEAARRLDPRGCWPNPDDSRSHGPPVGAQRTDCFRSVLRLLLP